MKSRTLILLLATHGVAGVFGFALGIYALPILIAPPAPTTESVQTASSQAMYTAQFKRDLPDSDALHWGEGLVSVGREFITFDGKLAPGPDYKLYLSPQYVETEVDFNRLKSEMVRVGEVKTFKNFVVTVPPHIDPASYNSVIVWCETFGQFITSANYK